MDMRAQRHTLKYYNTSPFKSKYIFEIFFTK